MNDRIALSRARLYAALAPLLPDGRVHQYVPAQIVSPAMWIERHQWTPTTEGRATVIVVTWTIDVVTDADTDEAQAFTDSVSAKVYDAVTRASFRPLSARHQTIDIGADNTTALVVTVDDVLAVTTLCLPDAPTAQPITRERTTVQ